MEGTKPRTSSSIGMFDMLKGAGMLIIVFAHTAELYPMQAVSGLSLPAFFPFIYREALLAAFFIASGYGFRKRSIRKCIEQQLKTLLKPYVYTALATTVLHAFIHHAAFGSWDAAISESAKVLGGFLLGLPHTATYFGQQFFSCGPMWYLVALMLAWVLLDVLLEIFPERYITPAVVGVTLLGWCVTLVWEAPFCIAQGMVSLPYLYIGYLAKKRRLFETPLSGRAKAGLIAAALGVVAGVLLTQSTDCVSMAQWNFGPVSILLDAGAGLGILSMVLWFQRRVDNFVIRGIQAIGRRSLYIFCIHTVELTAIPWYLMPQKFAAHPVLGVVLQFTLSMGSVLLFCELLLRWKDRKFRRTVAAKSREAQPRQYAAKH